LRFLAVDFFAVLRFFGAALRFAGFRFAGLRFLAVDFFAVLRFFGAALRFAAALRFRAGIIVFVNFYFIYVM